jgi:regulator of cell morphogenesis and NO signaling
MATQLSQTVVGKIVAQQPGAARVFEKYHIDYCCRGGTTLSEACASEDVDLREVVTEIEQLSRTRDSSEEVNWSEASLTELADHIVDTHHRFLSTELPRISGLIGKTVNAHGDKRPELSKVAETFRLMREELESHMAKEENILFPAIRTLETRHDSVSFPFGSVANPIGMMEHEHDDAGSALRRLRELTENFTPPRDACPTYRAMLDSLQNLEQDLHRHIHKENNILFPRAKELEQSVATLGGR